MITCVKRKERKRGTTIVELCLPHKTHSADIAINLSPQLDIKTCWILRHAGY